MRGVHLVRQRDHCRLVGDVQGAREQHGAAGVAICCATAWSPSSWMSVRTRRPPFAAVTSAVARPMPLAAPVTTQTLPSSRFIAVPWSECDWIEE